VDPIQVQIQASAFVIEKAGEECAESLRKAAELLVNIFRENGRVLTCGNGGSAADAQHAASELVVRLSGEMEGPALSAIALTTDSSVVTAAANDYGFERVFARQVEAHGREGDVLWLFTTSGRSANLARAAEAARKAGMKALGFTGADGGDLAGLCDVECRVPSDNTARVQETHGVMIHAVLDATLRALGYGPTT
jgi:D-sedoheptulose 7-phosphate isomerase